MQIICDGQTIYELSKLNVEAYSNIFHNNRILLKG